MTEGRPDGRPSVMSNTDRLLNEGELTLAINDAGGQLPRHQLVLPDRSERHRARDPLSTLARLAVATAT